MKHPVLSNKLRLIIWWLAWLILALGQLLSYYLSSGTITLLSICDNAISMLIFSGLALSIWYPFSYFNNIKTATGVMISNIIAGGAVSITLWILLTRLIVSSLFRNIDQYNLYWDETFYFRIGSGVFI